jgi:curli biogenesis system outer membrane secretion channel CsgG
MPQERRNEDMRNPAAVLGLCIALTASAQQQQRRTVAVENFDYSAVMTYVQAIFGTHLPVGQGIQALMVKRIAEGGRFTVVERRKIENVMKEQDFGASGRVDRPTAARIGKIRGADLILMGDVVIFGRDDQVRRGAGGVSAGGFGIAGGAAKADYKAVVAMNYRIVDSESGEIIQTGEARGESKRSSKAGGLALLAGGVRIGGAADVVSSNFAETIIGEAVMDCVDKLAAQVNQQSAGIGAKSIAIEASVATVSGGTVYINAGTNAGVQVGDRFEVSRLGKQIKDPATGEVLDQESTPIGAIVISQVREKVALGTFNGSGGHQPQAGDRVEKK